MARDGQFGVVTAVRDAVPVAARERLLRLVFRLDESRCSAAGCGAGSSEAEQRAFAETNDMHRAGLFRRRGATSCSPVPWRRAAGSCCSHMRKLDFYHV